MQANKMQNLTTNPTPSNGKPVKVGLVQRMRRMHRNVATGLEQKSQTLGPNSFAN